MKHILFILLLSSTIYAQNPTKFEKIKVTLATKLNNATRVIVQDSITKELHWVLKSTVGTGTVTSVTGTDGITVAAGTTTPVIGISSIAQSKVTNLVSDLSLKENTVNKQNSLITDGTGVKYPTVDAVNGKISNIFKDLIVNVNDGYPSNRNTATVIKGNSNGFTDTSKGTLSLNDNLDRPVLWADNSGRLNLYDYTGNGGTAVLYNLAASPIFYIGHYAFVARSSSGLTHTTNLIGATLLDNTSTSMSSSISLQWMTDSNTTTSYQQPNQSVGFSKNGMSMPNIPIVPENGTQRITGTLAASNKVTSSGSLVSKNGSDSVGAGANYNLLNLAGDRQHFSQLNASGGKDDWFFNGTSFIKASTLSNSGIVSFNSLAGATSVPIFVTTDGTLIRGTAAVSPIQLKDFFADVSNTGTTETNLYGYVPTDNRLASTGEKIVSVYGGTFNDATAASQLRIFFGNTTIIGDTGALTMSVTGAWIVNVSVMRTGVSTARSIVSISTPGASTASYTKYTSLTGVVFSGELRDGIAIKATASGATGGSGDITASYGNILWQPAAL